MQICNMHLPNGKLNEYFFILLFQAVLQDVPVPHAELLGVGAGGDELGADQLLVSADQLQLRGQGCLLCNEL